MRQQPRPIAKRRLWMPRSSSGTLRTREMNSTIKGALIIAAAIVIAAAMFIYFGPYQSCVRELRVSNPSPAATCANLIR